MHTTDTHLNTEKHLNTDRRRVLSRSQLKAKLVDFLDENRLIHHPLLFTTLSLSPPSLIHHPLSFTTLSHSPPSSTHHPLPFTTLSQSPPSLVVEGMAVGSLAPSVESAIAISPAVMVIFIVFGGLYVVHTPAYLQWVPKVRYIY